MKMQYNAKDNTSNFIGITVDEFGTLLLALALAEQESKSPVNKKKISELSLKIATLRANAEIIP